MNCCNGEKYLREALDSVLAQTYQEWELIFWDNLSTDNSAQILNTYKDNRIKYYLSDSFTPLGEARNQAIKKSKGDYIAFLDCDDLWFPEKLSKQVLLFDNPIVGLVICDTHFFNENGILKQLYKRNKPPVGMVFRELLRKYFISLETVIVRRKALESLNNGFDHRFSMIEECDLFVRLGYKWHLAYVDEVLAKWRVHEASWTWKHNDEIPAEKKLFLNNLREYIPKFDELYVEEIKLIKRSCALEEAYLAWSKENKKKARELLKPYRKSSLKWFVVYWVICLPYSWFATIKRLKDGVLPI